MLPEIRTVDGKLREELLKHFRANKDGYVQVGPEKWFYPIKYKRFAQDFIDFEVRSDDVWIMGYPRSGTTVTQDIAYFMNHDLDLSEIKGAAKERVKLFESAILLSDSAVQEREKKYPQIESINLTLEGRLQELRNVEGKRMIKTHLPFALLPPGILTSGCKVIYICRNPKDVAVSFFHLQKALPHVDFASDFSKYWEFFKNGDCNYGPYFEHVRQGYEKKDLENVLILFYEDLKKDLKGYIQKLSDFFKKPLTEKEMEDLVVKFSFDNYKKAAEGLGAPFVREGRVGGWRDNFSEEMNKEADEWIETNCKEIGFTYPSID